MTYRKSIRYIFWLLVILLSANAIRTHFSSLKAALVPAKIVPYTVVLQDYTIQPDGSSIVQSKLTMAVRSDGSRVMYSTSIDPAGLAERTIDFSSGRKVIVMERIRKKSTTFDSSKANPGLWLVYASNNCLMQGSDLQEEVADHEVIGGYRTVKLSTNFSSGSKMTRWLALDYGCALVQDRFEWQDGQASEKKLLSMTTSEPMTALFDEPAQFDEVSYSNLLSLGPSATSQDSYYYSHRPPSQ